MEKIHSCSSVLFPKKNLSISIPYCSFSLSCHSVLFRFFNYNQDLKNKTFHFIIIIIIIINAVNINEFWSIYDIFCLTFWTLQTIRSSNETKKKLKMIMMRNNNLYNNWQVRAKNFYLDNFFIPFTKHHYLQSSCFPNHNDYIVYECNNFSNMQ